MIKEFIVTCWWNILNYTRSRLLINLTYTFLMILPKTITVKKCLYSIQATTQQSFTNVEVEK